MRNPTCFENAFEGTEAGANVMIAIVANFLRKKSSFFLKQML
jgi:hypothetical protein